MPRGALLTQPDGCHYYATTRLLLAATDLAARLPITRQAIAKHLALLAGDWDSTLGALTGHLDQRGPRDGDHRPSTSNRED
jgi:hypothetical protein